MLRVRMLLIEDDLDHQLLLKRAICDDRPDVMLEVAGSAEEALEKIHGHTFDCIIMDYSLGDCTASELLPQVRAVLPQCPTIVISSSGLQQVVVDSIRCGGVDFIHKDDAVDSARLWERLSAALQAREKASQERRVRARRERKLIKLAQVDPLTGLFNRRTIDRFLDGGGRKRLDRRGKCVTAVIDLDHFKQINDIHGHEWGDRVLVRTADKLRPAAGPLGLAARWGGEEFLVIRPIESLGCAYAWAEDLLDQIKSIDLSNQGKAIAVSASIGFAVTPSSQVSQSTVIDADQAMYLAKKLGRGRIIPTEFATCWRMIVAGEGPPMQRWKHVLKHQLPYMGRTKRAHVTGHSLEVARLAVAMGTTLGLCNERLRVLSQAGVLHDMGKLLVPDSVLDKPGPLTGAENKLVEKAADASPLLSRAVGVEPRVSETLAHARARYDAMVLPELELEPAMVCVADAYSAMTSYRSYQPTLSRQDSLMELVKERGHQFHPVAVDAAMQTL